MSQALIRQTFETALNTWAAAQVPALPVQWQNVILDPEPAKYLRAFLLPAETESGDIARLNRRYSGIFQVSICAPVGIGPSVSEAIAAALAAVFSPSAPTTVGGLKVWCSAPMSIAAGINEPGLYVVPCSVPYLADTY